MALGEGAAGRARPAKGEPKFTEGLWLTLCLAGAALGAGGVVPGLAPAKPAAPTSAMASNAHSCQPLRRAGL